MIFRAWVKQKLRMIYAATFPTPCASITNTQPSAIMVCSVVPNGAPISNPASPPLLQGHVKGVKFSDIVWKKSRQARRLTLRVSPCHPSQKIVLTTPLRTPQKAAEAFLQAQKFWLANTLQKIPDPINLSQAKQIPLHNTLRTLIYGGESASDALCLLTPAHLKPWLWAYTRQSLQVEVDKFARQLGVTVTGLRIREMRSRWGSCASSGMLSFSWRLILTPPSVMSYVAAHEVAHRVEMNHSPRFWAIVERICPDWRAQRDWLKTHASDLMRFHF